MNVNYINPFISAIKNTLVHLDKINVNVGKLGVKKHLTINKNITVFSGLMGSIKGNVAYSCSLETGRALTELFLDIPSIGEFGETEISVVNELSNIFTTNALSMLSANGFSVKASKSTAIIGINMMFILSTVKTISVLLETEIGNFEINFGLEE